MDGVEDNPWADEAPRSAAPVTPPIPSSQVDISRGSVTFDPHPSSASQRTESTPTATTLSKPSATTTAVAPPMATTTPSAVGGGAPSTSRQEKVPSSISVAKVFESDMGADGEDQNRQGLTKRAARRELLLMVFIHGFKGSAETTFEDFPNRLSHVLAETHSSNLRIMPLVYPTYDTRGSLAIAVSNFCEWLTLQTVQLESKPELVGAGANAKELSYAESGRGGGRGTVKVVLCGHSMGGLVAVDAALRIANESAESTGIGARSLWPNIISVIAYDSPYYGVHPNVFRNQASKYISYAQQARDLGAHFAPVGAGLAALWGMNRSKDRGSTTPPSQAQQRQASTSGSSSGSRWTNALWATGAFATAAAVAGTGAAAYYKREQIGGAYSYMTDHFEYVSNLWDDKAMRERLDALVELPEVEFQAWYNRLPPLLSGGAIVNAIRPNRTFIILPPLSSPHTAQLFSPLEVAEAGNTRSSSRSPSSPSLAPVAATTLPKDEIEAHISMFSSTANPLGYLRLIKGSADVVGRALTKRQELLDDEQDRLTAEATEKQQQQGSKGQHSASSKGGATAEKNRRQAAASSITSATGGSGVRTRAQRRREEERKRPIEREEGLRKGDDGLVEEEQEVTRMMREASLQQQQEQQ